MNEVKKNGDDIKTIAEVMKNVIEQTDSLGKDVPVCFTELDSVYEELNESGLIVIASRPGRGKTSLALAMMRRIAIKKQIPAAFFSFDAEASVIGLRLLKQEAATSGELTDMTEAARKLSAAPIYLDDTSPMSITDICERIKAIVLSKSVKTVFIDYLGLIQGDKDVPRQEQLTEIRKTLKNIGKELRIKIIVLEQISRESKNIQHEAETISLEADSVLLLDVESGNPSIKIIKE